MGVCAVAPGCSVAPVGDPLPSVVAPGGSVASWLLRFLRCPWLLVRLADSPLPPAVPLIRWLRLCWFAGKCSRMFRWACGCSGAPGCRSLLLLCSVSPSVSPLSSVVAPGCSVAPGHCSRLLCCSCGCSVAPGCCSVAPGCCSRLLVPYFSRGLFLRCSRSLVPVVSSVDPR